MSQPTFLYKFMGRVGYCADLLRERRIYLSHAADFNDPFDLNIEVDVQIGEERYRRWVERHDVQKRTSAEEWARFFRERDFETPLGVKKLENSARDAVLSHGICCFCETGHDIRMWASYAANHTGVCLEFRPDYNAPPFENIQRVAYVERYPRVCIDEESRYEEFFSRKHPDWAGEREWRLIVANAVRTKVPFPPETLVRIVLGVRTSSEDEELLRRALETWPSAPPVMEKARLTKDPFGIGTETRGALD